MSADEVLCTMVCLCVVVGVGDVSDWLLPYILKSLANLTVDMTVAKVRPSHACFAGDGLFLTSSQFSLE